MSVYGRLFVLVGRIFIQATTIKLTAQPLWSKHFLTNENMKENVRQNFVKLV